MTSVQPLEDVFLRPIGTLLAALGNFWQFAHLNEAGDLLPAAAGGYTNVYANYSQNNIGGAATGPGASITRPKLSGGVLGFQTTAGADSRVGALVAALNVSPFANAVMVPSKPWYVAQRFKVLAAPTTDGQVWLAGWMDQVASFPGTLPDSYITLALDPVSGTNNYVITSANGGVPTYLDTGIAADSNWHDVALYSLDGVKAFLRFDAQVIGPYTYLQFGTDGQTGVNFARTTMPFAAAPSIEWDEGLWIGPLAA